MTRITREVKTTKEVTDRVICDKCKCCIESSGSFSSASLGAISITKYNGDWTVSQYDICSSCFDQHVKPALRAIGIEPQVTPRKPLREIV